MPTDEWFAQQKEEALKWAYDTVVKEFVVLDTETTSLKGEILQIAIIDNNGNTLLNQLVKPKGQIEPGAAAVHHITEEVVKDAPTWDQVYPKVKELIEGKLVIAYNIAFDKPMLKATGDLYELPEIEATWECAMMAYAKYTGKPKWSYKYNNFSYSKLVEAVNAFNLVVDKAHDACGDVLMTLEIMKAMANIYQPKVELY